MNDRLILETLSSDAYYPLNKKMLQKFGPEVAVFITGLVNQVRIHNTENEKDFWFYYKHSDQITNFGMGIDSIRKCKEKCKRMGILETKGQGMPYREWYKVHIDILYEKVFLDEDHQPSAKPYGQGSENRMLDPPLFGPLSLEEKRNDLKKEIFSKKYLISQFPQNWQEHPAFCLAIEKYIQSRKEMNHPKLGKTGITALVNKLTKTSIQDATAALEESVSNGWQGVFLKKGNGSEKQRPAQSNRLGAKSDQFDWVKSKRLINGVLED